MEWNDFQRKSFQFVTALNIFWCCVFFLFAWNAMNFQGKNLWNLNPVKLPPVDTSRDTYPMFFGLIYKYTDLLGGNKISLVFFGYLNTPDEICFMFTSMQLIFVIRVFHLDQVSVKHYFAMLLLIFLPVNNQKN